MTADVLPFESDAPRAPDEPALVVDVEGSRDRSICC
jgi:hypothetical protein